MADSQVFTARDGAVFIQRAPSLDPEYFGCVDLDDVSGDEGDITLIQCFDVNGRYETRGHTEDAPSPVTTTLTLWLGKSAEFLERVACPFYLHVNKRCGGVANVLNNYERAIIIKVVKKTNRTLTGLVMRNEDAQSEQSFALSAYPPILDVYDLTPDRQTTSEAQAANDIALVKENLCEGCTPRYEPGSIGIITHDAVGAGTANVSYTLNGGSTWATAAADPFGVNEHIMPAAYVWLDAKTIRFIVGRGVTDAGNPAEIAYTDFNVETGTAIGAAWTTANVGSTNAQFFFGPKSIFAYDRYNIWAVAGAGYIYKSEDAGVTWTAQEAGILSVDDYYVVRAAPGSKKVIYVAGENNAMARTLDGGVTWSAVTGPSGTDELLTLEVISKNVVVVGDNAGDLWITYNGGLSWTRITNFTGVGVGMVRAVEFLNEVQGYMLTNNASPVGTVHVTRDCGRSWEALTTPTNAGLNALAVIRSDLVFAVGEPQASTAMILRTVS